MLYLQTYYPIISKEIEDREVSSSAYEFHKFGFYVEG